jgi:hypothetical protein
VTQKIDTGVLDAGFKERKGLFANQDETFSLEPQAREDLAHNILAHCVRLHIALGVEAKSGEIVLI